MDVATPGKIVGKLNFRAHQAVVDITYDAKSCNIRYRAARACCTARQIKLQDKKLVKFTKTTMAG